VGTGTHRLVLQVEPPRRLVPPRRLRIAVGAVARLTPAETRDQSEQRAIAGRRVLAVVAAAGERKTKRRRVCISQRAFEDLRHEQDS
jgi:hypothetical protein